MQKVNKEVGYKWVKSDHYSSRSTLIRTMVTLSWDDGLHFWELIYMQCTDFAMILLSPIYRKRNWGLERWMTLGYVPNSHDLNGGQSNFRDHPLLHYTYCLPNTDTF